MTDEPTNKQRATWAHVALTHYANAKEENLNPIVHSDDDIADLMADLLHLAELQGHDACLVAARALGNYKVEATL